MTDTPSNALAPYPPFPARRPTGLFAAGRYRIRFARDAADLETVQSLRYRVFAEEMGADLGTDDGLDADRFDRSCHHLMVETLDGSEVVGTYRMMTYEMAQCSGFYSSSEFTMDALPISVLAEAVEVGRACVHPEHRNGRVIQLLWRGITRYMLWNERRFLFGCSSLPTTDAREVAAYERTLVDKEALHPTLRVKTYDRNPIETLRLDPENHFETPLPPLFSSYLRLGARVISEPFFDYPFGVTDFMILLDLEQVPQRIVDFFGRQDMWSVNLEHNGADPAHSDLRVSTEPTTNRNLAALG